MRENEATDHDDDGLSGRTEALRGRGEEDEKTIGFSHEAAESGLGSSFDLGPYRVLRELGRGGMGIVYLAEDSELKRRVALKVLPEGLGRDPALLARFRREAEVASRLDHPNLCGVLRVGETDGRPWIAMRYLEGDPLDRIIRDKRSDDLGRKSAATRTSSLKSVLTPRVEIIETISRALHEAHSAGILHRDLKPGNVIIQKDGSPVVLDFGLALDLLGEEGAGLTQSGDLLGTPHYMAPEQIRGQAHTADPRIDVWALGVMLFEILSGQRPFVGATRDALYRAILDQDPPSLRQLVPGLPRDLETIVATALQKAPERRYDSARALADDLRALLEIRPIQARPAGPIEKLMKSARRRPALATLVLVMLVAMPTLGTLLASRSIDRSRLGEALERGRSEAEADLGAGRLVAAARALDAARRIDADATFITALTDRLDRARGEERVRMLALDDESDPEGSEALRTIDDVLLRHPDSREPRLWRALILLRRGQAKEARRELEALGPELSGLLDLDADQLAARPPQGDLQGLLEVVLLSERQRPQQALGRLELLMTSTPGDTTLAWLAAEQASRLQDFRAALAHAGRVKALVREFSPLQKARYSVHLRRAGHVKEALAIAAEARAEAPADPLVRLHHASSLDEAGRKEEAIVEFGEVERSLPRSSAVFRNHAAALLDLGRTEEAVPVLRKALEIAPEDPDLLVNLACALREIGDSKKALELFDRALSLRPDFPFALNNKAVALKDLGRLAESEEAARAALSLRPNYPECLHNLGTVLVGLERGPEALEAFEKAIELAPDFVPPLVGAGTLELKAQRYAEALARFEAALARSPGESGAWLHLPLVYEGLGRVDEALSAGETAIRLWPTESQGWLNYGSALLNAGKRDEAVPVFERALELHPDEGRVSLILVVLLAERDIETATACILRLEDLEDPFFKHVSQFVDTLVTAAPAMAPRSFVGRACTLRLALAEGLDDAEKALLATLLADLEAAPATETALEDLRRVAAARSLARSAAAGGETAASEKARALVETMERNFSVRGLAARERAEELASREPERSRFKSAPHPADE